ncbi:MAG: hypothetical protein Q8T08_13430 [Ignavibacteria bacterium]|nr:hypothetical protein [Ignavibacteria bacterium]
MLKNLVEVKVELNFGLWLLVFIIHFSPWSLVIMFVDKPNKSTIPISLIAIEGINLFAEILIY